VEQCEFTYTDRDRGWQAFLSASAIREDPLFVKDGRLFIDVRIAY